MSAASKARRMLFYLKPSFAALTKVFFSPFHNFIRPHLEYAIQAAHPFLSRDAEALEKVQKFSPKFVKGLRYVPYEAAPTQPHLFFLTRRRIRGDLIVMFNITHGLLEFPMESTSAQSTCKGLHGYAYKFHQQRCCKRRHQFAFTNRTTPMWNKLSAVVVNASSTQCFNTTFDVF